MFEPRCVNGMDWGCETDGLRAVKSVIAFGPHCQFVLNLFTACSLKLSSCWAGSEVCKR